MNQPADPPNRTHPKRVYGWIEEVAICTSGTLPFGPLIFRLLSHTLCKSHFVRKLRAAAAYFRKHTAGGVEGRAGSAEHKSWLHPLGISGRMSFGRNHHLEAAWTDLCEHDEPFRTKFCCEKCAIHQRDLYIACRNLRMVVGPIENFDWSGPWHETLRDWNGKVDFVISEHDVAFLGPFGAAVVWDTIGKWQCMSHRCRSGGCRAYCDERRPVDKQQSPRHNWLIKISQNFHSPGSANLVGNCWRRMWRCGSFDWRCLYDFVAFNEMSRVAA